MSRLSGDGEQKARLRLFRRLPPSFLPGEDVREDPINHLRTAAQQENVPYIPIFDTHLIQFPIDIPLLVSTKSCVSGSAAITER